MPHADPEQRDGTPTIEVRVFRNGVFVTTELCESEEEVGVVVDGWCELDGVECVVGDLSGGDEDLAAVEGGDEEYPELAQFEVRRHDYE